MTKEFFENAMNYAEKLSENRNVVILAHVNDRPESLRLLDENDRYFECLEGGIINHHKNGGCVYFVPFEVITSVDIYDFKK